MTLANMRRNGVHAVIARCEACGHAADVNVDAVAETIIVPEVGRRLRCSGCGTPAATDEAGKEDGPTVERTAFGFVVAAKVPARFCHRR
jgi:hypothetical protein